MLITHDRHLIETCADRLWLVADGTVAPYDGDIDDYRRQVLSQRRQPRQRPVGDEATAEPPRRNKREARQASARRTIASGLQALRTSGRLNVM